MKKGTRVEFTTKSGKVIEGILQETIEKRAVVKSGNRTYKPPIELVKKAKKKPAKKETPKPKPKAKKEDEVRPVDKKVPNIPLPKKTTGEIKKPKGVPKPDKEILQAVMGVMTEVAKGKEKSTQKQKDEGLKFDKKIRDGKLTYKDFEEEVFNDDKAFDHIKGFEDDMGETQGYNMEYWYSKVTSRDIFSWDDLTENQQERLQNIMAKDIEVMTRKKMKNFYKEFIKGKKFKNFKEIVSVLIKEYDEVTFNH